MKIAELLRSKAVTLSFEVFPPKNDAAFESVRAATQQIASLRPDFMSVTYGAGGSGSAATLELAAHLLQSPGIPVTAHLTCIGATRASIDGKIRVMREAGIENVMALRGDLPLGSALPGGDFAHASVLIAYLRAQGDWSIGGACYPEVHPESPNSDEDMRRLREKVDAGVDFLTTQMFFDNALFYRFLWKAREAGIPVPVVAGIMPVTSGTQVGRIRTLSGSYLPHRFMSLVDKWGHNPAAMEQAGVAYATDQIVDLLANGVRAIHIYTMNKPSVAEAILANLSQLLAP